MKKTLPTFRVTENGLVIRIPWQALQAGLPQDTHPPRLTIQRVLQLVGEGRRAHRQGKTKLIGSLRELLPR